MSEESVSPPLDIVKVEVEVEEDDESGGRGPGGNEVEVDSDADLLESVASLLCDGPWLSFGTGEGENLVGRLLDLGEKLEGWKKWEGMCRLKEEKNRNFTHCLAGAELRFEMMKNSKAELRKTYDLEVDLRIKTELEVAELRKKTNGVVDPVLTEVGVQTLVASEPDDDDVTTEDPAASCEPATSDPLTTSPSPAYNLRKRSNRGSRVKAKDEKQLVLDTPEDESDVEETAAKITDPPQQKKTQENPLPEQVKGQFPCRFCNKKFSNKSQFQRHLGTHTPDKIFKCKVCWESFKTSDTLRQHAKLHDPNRTKDFACPTCSKSFYSSKNLTEHLVTHRSARPFKCPQCSQRFKLKGSLTKHLRTHSERRPFGCEFCEKTFKQWMHLVQHLRTHTGERPYSCHVCKKAFKVSSHLKDHARTHLGEEGKIHQCPFCDRKFVEKSKCRRHERTRHKSKFAAPAQRAQPEPKQSETKIIHKTGRSRTTNLDPDPE